MARFLKSPCVAVPLFLIAFAARSGRADDRLFPILGKAIEAERKLDMARFEIERTERSYPVTGGLDQAAKTETPEILAKGKLGASTTYRLAEQKAAGGASVLVPQIKSSAPVEASAKIAGADGESRAVNLFTVSAQSLFAKLDPAKTDVFLVSEDPAQVELKVVPREPLGGVPMHLEATFEKGSGLLKKSVLVAKGAPIIVAEIQYAKDPSGAVAISRRSVRVNSPDGVWLSREELRRG
ncbi:MAG: hypothetical protein HY721_14550 [Planctomycetes bacterium]|nr:hypothetical protein [Planctomycetota bacterium]